MSYRITTYNWKHLVGDILMFLTAVLLGAALNVAAFVYVMGKYVQPFPVIIDTCQKPQASPPKPQLMSSTT